MKRFAPVAVSFAFCVAGAGWAAETPQQPKPTSAQSGEDQRLPDPEGRPSFASLDRDRDGAITRMEAATQKELLVDFDQIDLTKDSRLDAAEYRSYYSAGYGEY